MARFTKAALLSAIFGATCVSAFTPMNLNIQGDRLQMRQSPTTSSSSLFMSTEAASSTDFNAVKVAKTGGRGVVTAAQDAADKNLSLGAPRERPDGGHFLTKGGVQITAQVDSLQFVNKNVNGESSSEGTSVRAIEDLIDQLDDTRGVLLSSSYEFPGR